MTINVCVFAFVSESKLLSIHDVLFHDGRDEVDDEADVEGGGDDDDGDVDAHDDGAEGAA